MSVKGGRLELLVPHLLRGQLLRPGFVRMSLKLGAARQMPGWAKLQFLNGGVRPDDLDRVLGKVTSLESWVDEWDSLGREQLAAARRALGFERSEEARDLFLAASASFNFAQYVMFLDLDRKRMLHEACTSAYALAAPLFDPPAVALEVPYRRRTMRGYLRVPNGESPAPIVVMFNGTNAVKEELHWWSTAFLERGLATLTFDGPGLGQTFHRMSMIAEPRPVGLAVVNELQMRPDIDPEAIAFFGLSLGGYLVIRMASFDSRIRAVAAVSAPYSAEVYWNVTLAGMRRELAALYGLQEAEMGSEVHRITLAQALPALRSPLLVAGGGHDLVTPADEAFRIYEAARCERELVYYPRGGHDCFNVLGDLRPRVAGWMARHLQPHRSRARRPFAVAESNGEGAHLAAEAVDPEFGDALAGDATRLRWNHAERAGLPAHWRPVAPNDEVEVVVQRAPAQR